MYGKKEQVLDLFINDNGTVFIPSVGPINIMGLTIRETEKKLKDKLSTKHTNFELSVKLNSLKKVNVIIAGDVKAPGSYSVNRFENLISILSLSGGIRKTGSLRSIKIMRKGKTVHTVDLYDIFFNGDNSSQVYLQPDDYRFL